MQKSKKISIGADFSETPIGRYLEDGDFSGQRFREEFLVPALNDFDKIAVQIDDTEGYGSSFLDEAFGGLIRHHPFTERDLREKITILCEKPEFKIYEKMVWHYISESNSRKLS
jgi:hypothetical protein